MGIQEKIERLIEERQAQAIKKDLTRKLRSIVNILGFVIRGSGSGGSTATGGPEGTAAMGYYSEALEDNWEWDLDEEDDQKESPMPTASLDDHGNSHGGYFDGLSSGINMQIFYLESDESIKVTHEGVVVYKDTRGRIECYVPSEKWESQIESLFTAAEKKAKVNEQKEALDKEGKGRKRMSFLIDHLRKTWGL